MDDGTLKRHVAASEGAAVAPPAFVELAPMPTCAPGACVIDVTGPQATVHIRLASVALADVAALSRLLMAAG